MAITRDAVTHYDISTGGTLTNTQAHALTNGTDDDDRMMLMAFATHNRDDTQLTSLEYNGVAGTFVGVSGDGATGMRYLLMFAWDDADLPADTSSHDFEWVWSEDPVEYHINVREISGALQGAIGTMSFAALMNGSADPQVFNYTPANDAVQLFLDYFHQDSRTISSEPTTLEADYSPTGLGEARTYYRTGPNPASEETYTWDLNNSTRACLAVWEIEEAGAGGGTTHFGGINRAGYPRYTNKGVMKGAVRRTWEKLGKLWVPVGITIRPDGAIV